MFGRNYTSPTLVAVHAHPDDEAIFTGGTLRRAVQRGWRVIVVFATSGEAGFAVADCETGARRRDEAEAACATLGVHRAVFLGYRDSGDLPGGPFGPDTLAAAGVVEAAARLGAELDGESPTAITAYDADGIYGHPDHVAVHRLVEQYAAARRVPMYGATVCRSHLRALRAELVAGQRLQPSSWPVELTDRVGRAGDDLLVADVSKELAAKRAAVAAHGSQIVAVPTFMGLPPGAFERLLQYEWYQPLGRVRSVAFEQLVRDDLGCETHNHREGVRANNVAGRAAQVLELDREPS